MGGSVSRSSLEIQVSNQTRNFTLENPRTYFVYGLSSVPPIPELLPGSSDSCHFCSPSDSASIQGLLTYEAESFTLAIFFLIPPEPENSPLQLGLELSLDKAHLGGLEEAFFRILKGSSPPGPEGTSGAVREIHPQCQEPARVSAGPVKVTATMSHLSHGRGAVLRVVLGERGEAGKETPGAGKDGREK